MPLTSITGLIERRILANYRIDPECMSRMLPAPFRPQTVDGYAIGGICLIRLKQIRPSWFPFEWGLGSENAAHRIAVEWEADGETKQGVYIPRRDTNSRLMAFAGGRLFSGVHHYANFAVRESQEYYSVTMNGIDDKQSVHISGCVANTIAECSVFESLEAASRFFEQGSLGYSQSTNAGRYDGLELNCKNWDVQAMDVDSIHSHFFEDRSQFPKGSVEFDCALLMRRIDHHWLQKPRLCCE